MKTSSVSAFFLGLCLSLTTSASSAEKAQCPERDIAQAPLCPDSGTVMLDDQYPVATAVVSAFSAPPDHVKDFVTKVARAQTPAPRFVITMDPQQIAEFKKWIAKSNLPEDVKKNPQRYFDYIPSSSKFAFNDLGSHSMTWQQDFFESQFDSRSGNPVMRPIDVIGGKKAVEKDSYLSAFGSVINKCSIGVGKMMSAQRDSMAKNDSIGGVGGGNIEALPGGICMLGGDAFRSHEQWKDYAAQACGPDSPVLKTPSEFLRVGHTDEIITMLPDKTQKAPCDFSVLVASPQKALDVLSQNPSAPFFAPQMISQSHSFIRSCAEILQWLDDAKTGSPVPKSETSKGISRIILENSTSAAFAGLPENNLNDVFIHPEKCGKITNGDFLRFYQGDIRREHETVPNEFRLVNQSIQKTMTNFKPRIEKMLKHQLPQCQIEIKDAPYLFTGMYDQDSKEAVEALSLFPNPTNGVVVGSTYLLPRSGNSAIEKSMEDLIQKQGLKVEKLDTFDFHAAEGNLHCRTHLFRYCRPRGQK